MTFFSLLDNVRCFECGETVPIPNLEEHMTMSHGYVKCQKCDQLFIPYRFDEHIRRYHKTDETPLDIKFACVECNEKVFFVEFGKHLLIKHNYAECGVCHLLCPEKDLEKHMGASHRLRKCVVCSGYFKDLEKHLDEKHGKTICIECGMLASSHDIVSHLKNSHAYIQCDVCEEPVKPGILKGHMQVHGMVECQVCSGFYLRDMLEAHLLEEHNKKTCPKCTELFENESLNEHIKKRHFYIECEVCGILRSPIMMDTHLRESHGFRSCPRCGVVMDEKRLRGHIKNSHYFS